MAYESQLRYEDCTIGANEPLDKYTINRAFRRLYSVATDRVDRLRTKETGHPFLASSEANGIVRFVGDYANSNQRSVSDSHVMNLKCLSEYMKKDVLDGKKLIRNEQKAIGDALGDRMVYTELNRCHVNILPNGVKILNGSFVLGVNHLDLDTIKEHGKTFLDPDLNQDTDPFYSTLLNDGKTKIHYIPYMDRARMDKYQQREDYSSHSSRRDLSENLYEHRMRGIHIITDPSGERNKYVVESLFNLSFSIQDFTEFCDLYDDGTQIIQEQTKITEYPTRFYYYRKPVILVQAVDVSPDYNRFNRLSVLDKDPQDLEVAISSGVGSTYVPPRNTAFVTNFSCDYDVAGGYQEKGMSDLVGSVQNNTLSIGISTRYVIGDSRDNVGYASASKINHKIKVTFMLIGV